MDAIFHERQEGSLCAQHCLNALLQGSYFTAVDLAELGRQLDERERATMAEAGIGTEEYRRFTEQPSGNYDDSGFFSIQVIENAVKVWNLMLKPLKSSDALAVSARENPSSQQGFICNFKEHWFSIRKVGQQWFNLNSLLTGPELLSDTFLHLFLKQLETEGYSIFIVLGDIPECEADSLLRLCPAVQPIKPKLISESIKEKTGGASTSSSGQFSGDDLERALAVSQQIHDEDDPTLQEALKMSMEGIVFEPGGTEATTNSTIPAPSAEEVRSKRLAFLDKVEGTSQGQVAATSCELNRGQQEQSAGQSSSKGELSEEEMLKIALEMSMKTEEKT